MREVHLAPSEAIGLIASREIQARLRSKAFRVITAVLVLAVVGLVLVFHVLGHRTHTATERVGVTAAIAAYQGPLVAAGQTIGQPIVTSVVDRDAGERRVREGSLDALLVPGPAAGLGLVVGSAAPNGLEAIASAVSRQGALNRQVVSLGGDPGAVDRTVAAASVVVQRLEPVDPHRTARIGMSSVVGVLSYIMLLISIQLTGQGVVEEKANRIVELLLATIRPWELLAGKVLGVGVVTIAQVALVAALGVGAAVATGVLHMSVAVVTGVVGWALLWYLLGYFLYALVIAAAASLVSRQEDLASVATPVTVVIIAAYLIGQTIVPANPNGTTATVLSMIPFLSPVLMPMRAAYDVPGWQMAAAAALTLVTIGLTARLAGRVYRRAVLLTGKRVSLRAALAGAG